MEGHEGINHFLESNHEGFAILDGDGKFLYFTENTPKILGCSHGDLQSKGLYDLIVEEDKDRAAHVFKDAFDTGESEDVELRFMCEGVERWIEWSLTHRDGKLYAIARDISSVHKERETLKVAQNRLRLLHQATSNPTQSLSEKIERVLNLGNLQLGMDIAIVSQVEEESFTAFRTKKNNDSVPITLGQQINLKQTFDSITMQAGNLIGIQNISRSVYDEHPAHTVTKLESYIGMPLYIEGEIFGVLSFGSLSPRDEVFDITDYDFVRLVAQWISSSLALLLANEQIAYTASIVSSSDDAIVGQDKEGTITTWNAGAEKLFQYTEEEVLGKQFSILIPDDLLEEREVIMKQLLKGETVDHYDTLRKKKDGTQVDVSVTVSPINDDNGEIVGASAVLRDITREKQIDRAKTEFVSLASHQLRTPLSAINWYAELLRDGAAGKMSKQQREFVDEIFEGNQRMVRLVNELLNVSRIDFGNFTIEPVQLDVLEISKSVVKELTPSIQKKKLNVKEDYDTKEIQYLADPNILRIVIQNLVSNAVKYTPDKGKIIVRIGTNEEKKELFIEVEDNGFGIPADQQDQIFSKLFRADNVLAMDTVGTGLGLYVLKAIVEESGGTVSFDSVLDEGTTFRIKLPLSGMVKKEGGKSLSQVTP